MRRIIVCGGRNYDNRALIFETLDAIHMVNPIVLLIHGDYGKTDRTARDWAIERGVKEEPHPPEWERYGKRAGPMRNTRMAARMADMVVAFPGDRGTEDMCNKARRAHIPVRVVAAPKVMDEQIDVRV